MDWVDVYGRHASLGNYDWGVSDTVLVEWLDILYDFDDEREGSHRLPDKIN